MTDEDRFTYTLQITYNGPSDADDMVIRDRMPGGVEFVSAPGGGAYVAANRTVTCDAGVLASGAAAERRITVRAKTPGRQINTATVTSGTDDPNNRNNSDTATVESGVKDPSPANNADTESTRAKPAPEPIPPAGCEATPGSGKVIKGMRGNDVLRGTPGNDTIYGFGGGGAIYGEGRSDALNVSDGAPGDWVDGGSGRDTCSFDRGDRVKGCP